MNFNSLAAGPYITQRLPNTTDAVITNPLQLECIAQSREIPHITWYKNSQLVSLENDGIQITNQSLATSTLSVLRSQLNFSSVSLSDAGVYKCEFQDSEGINSTTTILDILGTPGIIHFVYHFTPGFSFFLA